ncbi:storkhead-box protein 1 [Caerostris extrusa]|uniref:Storkhead-box protein 1 n=1 Tax=Caerostris extrusa TaxID=172846 RepID=A0AAV4UAS7_CAEEX|nr:storkhead-box protein 1 [Caerostris extrusa]
MSLFWGQVPSPAVKKKQIEKQKQLAERIACYYENEYENNIHEKEIRDLDPVTMSLVAQTQFAPLPEALCKVVYDLTSEGVIASMQIISKRLKTTFPELTVPSDDILYKTLGTLIKERKLYHTGSGYSVVTPDTFRLLAMSPPLERQMLLTNEEAIVRLHGTAYALTTEGRPARRPAAGRCSRPGLRRRGSWSPGNRVWVSI